MLLNLDAGERDDEPPELWELADLLCVACGGHAGDVASMTRIATFCAARARPKLGAHPSYPDREGFGRRTIAIEADSLRATIAEQCTVLASVARAHGVTVGWVKPHGALYHDAAANPVLARAVIEGARAALGDVVIIGPPRGALREVAGALAGSPARVIGSDLGAAYLREGFADRNTRPDGSLVPRGEPDALIVDPARAAARTRTLLAEVDTICVHADTPGALEIARAVRGVIDA